SQLQRWRSVCCAPLFTPNLMIMSQNTPLFKLTDLSIRLRWGTFDAKVVSIADQRVATGAPKYAAAAVKQANKGLPGRVAEMNRRSF
ncbi:hypothetical protein, partial [Pseudovibrio sp. Ad5]|uniref:hypothetical protein n=1 Tax=Pseudovibrio sp. Ad5 TaxID=989436 RepID=UPI000A7074AD